jgi:hypothetical protein
VQVNCHLSCVSRPPLHPDPLLGYSTVLLYPRMFENCTDFNIQGGSLYHVTGDVYLQNQQHLTIQHHISPSGAVQLTAGRNGRLDSDRWNEAAGHELSGMARKVRHARSAPYSESKFASWSLYVSYPQICIFVHGFRQALPILKSTQNRHQRPRPLSFRPSGEPRQSLQTQLRTVIRLVVR